MLQLQPRLKFEVKKRRGGNNTTALRCQPQDAPAAVLDFAVVCRTANASWSGRVKCSVAGTVDELRHRAEQAAGVPPSDAAYLRIERTNKPMRGHCRVQEYSLDGSEQLRLLTDDGAERVRGGADAEGTGGGRKASAFKKSVPRRDSMVDAEVRQQGNLGDENDCMMMVGEVQAARARLPLDESVVDKIIAALQSELDRRKQSQKDDAAKDETRAEAGDLAGSEEPLLSHPDTDDFGRAYATAGPTPAAQSEPQGERICTEAELKREVERLLGHPVRDAELAVVSEAFRDGGVGNVDAAAVFEAGFGHFLTDTLSRRFYVGMAVLMEALETPTKDLTGESSQSRT